MKRISCIFSFIIISFLTASVLMSCGLDNGKIEDRSGDTSAVIAEGECGEHIKWCLYEDGLLSIYGKGDMWDYDDWIVK